MSSLRGRKKGQQGQRQDDNSKKGPSRKLDFTPQTNPFSGKVFYLDMTKTRGKIVTKLKTDLQDLGGTVEEFLTKDISYVISDRSEVRYKLPGSHANQSGTSPAVSTPSPFQAGRDSGLGATDSPTAQPTNQGVVTRGKLIANKASFPATRGSTDVLETARNWKIPVYFLDSFQKFLAREKLKQKATGSKTKDKHPTTSQKSKQKEVRLQRYFLKAEDFNRRFRPITKEMAEFPRVILDTTDGACPFDATSSARIPHEERRPSARTQEQTAQAQGTPKEGAKVKESERTKEAAKPKKGSAKRQKVHFGAQPKHVSTRGYCECCRTRYNVLEQHLKSFQHQEFVDEAGNYSSLDTMISEGPNLERFLEDCVTYQPIDEEMNMSDTDDEDVLLISDGVTNKRSPSAHTKSKATSSSTSPKSPSKRKQSLPRLSNSRKSPRKTKDLSHSSPKGAKSPTPRQQKSKAPVCATLPEQHRDGSEIIPQVTELRPEEVSHIEEHNVETIDQNVPRPNDQEEVNTPKSATHVNVSENSANAIQTGSLQVEQLSLTHTPMRESNAAKTPTRESCAAKTPTGESSLANIHASPRRSSERRKLSPKSRLSLTRRRKKLKLLTETSPGKGCSNKFRKKRKFFESDDEVILIDGEQPQGNSNENLNKKEGEASSKVIPENDGVDTCRVIRNDVESSTGGDSPLPPSNSISNSKNYATRTTLDKRKKAKKSRRSHCEEFSDHSIRCSVEAVAVFKKSSRRKKGVKHAVAQTGRQLVEKTTESQNQTWGEAQGVQSLQESADIPLNPANAVEIISGGRVDSAKMEAILRNNKVFSQECSAKAPNGAVGKIQDQVNKCGKEFDHLRTTFRMEEEENEEGNFEGFSQEEIQEAESIYEALSLSQRQEQLKSAALNVDCLFSSEIVPHEEKYTDSVSSSKSLEFDIVLQGVPDFPSEGSEWEAHVHGFMAKLDEALESKRRKSVEIERADWHVNFEEEEESGKENREDKNKLIPDKQALHHADEKLMEVQKERQSVKNVPQEVSLVRTQNDENIPTDSLNKPVANGGRVLRKRSHLQSLQGGLSKDMARHEKRIRSPGRSKPTTPPVALKEISNNVPLSPVQQNPPDVVVCSTPKSLNTTRRDLFGVSFPTINFHPNLPPEEQNIILENYVHDVTEDEISFPKLSSPAQTDWIISPVKHLIPSKKKKHMSPPLSRISPSTVRGPRPSASPKSPSANYLGVSPIRKRRRSSTDSARKALFLRFKVSPSSKSRSVSDYPMSPPVSPFKSKGSIGSPHKYLPPLFALLYDSSRKGHSPPILVTNRRPNFSARILQPRRLSVKKRKTNSRYRNLVALNLSIPSDYNFDVYEFHDDGSMADEDDITIATTSGAKYRRRSVDSSTQTPTKIRSKKSHTIKRKKTARNLDVSLTKDKVIKDKKSTCKANSEMDQGPRKYMFEGSDLDLPFDLPISFYM